jgi:hypothetical protein
MTKNMMRRMCVAAGLLVGVVTAQAITSDAQIMIDRALNSPTLTVRYTGAHAALVELRVNGESLGTRSVIASKDAGETNFSLNLTDLKDGDNEVEIRLFDRTGKLVGSDHTNISTEQTLNAPVFLTTPKIGQTVRGMVDIKLGFGQTLKDVYVSFFVDNDFKSMSNVPPYQYSWDSSRETNGWHELEAWAIDGSSTTFKTRKVKVLVNNPHGDTHRIGVDEGVKPSENPNQVTIQNLTAPQIRASAVHSGQAAVETNALGAPPKLHGGNTAGNGLHVSIDDIMVGEKMGVQPGGVPTGVRQLFPSHTRIAVTSSSHPAMHASIRSLPIAGQIGSAALHTPTAVRTIRIVSNSRLRNNPNTGEMEVRVHPSSVRGPVVQNVSGVPSAPVLRSVENASNFIQITRGQRIPDLGSFAVILNSQFVNFDVPTRVDGGVPMAPFRHLIEKSGGSVDWNNLTKSVNANADGHNIFLHIGDKDAKINNSIVMLDLAPYIDRGRTVVPISFMTSALNVNVEYDKTTGHVLITSKKQ